RARARLRELFPEVFVDGQIDVDRLRARVGEPARDDATDGARFGLTWHGKARARRLAERPPTAALIPDRAGSLRWDAARDVVLTGDNLEALRLLQRSYRGRARLIYLDPPYNTGNPLSYRDRFRRSRAAYLRDTGQVDAAGDPETAGRLHTAWLSMMAPRLELARELLREDGSIWISIDDGELAHLRLLCDELFDAANFVATFVWEKRTTRENRRAFSFNHDYILCYARDKARFEAGRNLLPRDAAVLSRYANPDDDPRGPWQSVSLNAQAGHATPTQFYALRTPGGREVTPPPGRCWSLTRERMQALIDDGRVWFGARGNNVPRRKVFLAEARSGLTPHTLWTAAEVGTNDRAKKHLVRLLEGAKPFDTPKPVALLERIVEIASDPGDLVVDLFAGSGTTGEAVWRVNLRAPAPRRFVLVQLPEPTGDATYPTIDAQTRARLRAAAQAIADEPRPGFRSMHITEPDADADASDDDRLRIALLLHAGVELGASFERRRLAGHAVDLVDDRGVALVLCLAGSCSAELLAALAALRPTLPAEVSRVLLRATAFADEATERAALARLRAAGFDEAWAV
ncbi:MAG: site-specific DNA-methyltransferase, partial [Myxococcales bacterium]|nr:site-specific DNA-methyltransferase [Myxococcales bacterium]